MWKKIECAICLADVDVWSGVRLHRCGHMYHRKCIQGWLLKHSTCPLCRCEVCPYITVYLEYVRDIKELRRMIDVHIWKTIKIGAVPTLYSAYETLIKVYDVKRVLQKDDASKDVGDLTRAHEKHVALYENIQCKKWCRFVNMLCSHCLLPANSNLLNALNQLPENTTREQLMDWISSYHPRFYMIM